MGVSLGTSMLYDYWLTEVGEGHFFFFRYQNLEPNDEAFDTRWYQCIFGALKVGYAALVVGP